MSAPQLLSSLASERALWCLAPRPPTNNGFSPSILKVDRQPTAAAPTPLFMNAIARFKANCTDWSSGLDVPDPTKVDRVSVFAVMMMRVGIVIRRKDGKRASQKPVDLIWFPSSPDTVFFANKDMVAYAGEIPAWVG